MMRFFLNIYRAVYRLVPVRLRPRYILEARARASQWKKVRADHLKKYPQCAACGRTKNLAAHHVIPVSFDPNKELDPNNLLTLCETPCHIVFGHFFSYHCYNKDVRKVTAAFYAALQNNRKCLPPKEISLQFRS